MKKSIRLKLLWLFFQSLGVALCVSLVLHNLLFPLYYMNHIEERLLVVYDLIDSNGEGDLSLLLSDLDEAHQIGIVLTDSSLNRVTFSFNHMSGSEQRLDRDIHSLIQTELPRLKRGHIFVTLSSEGGNEGMPPRKVFVKALSNGGYCVLTHPLESLESTLDTMSDFHFMAGAIACLLGMISTFFFSQKFTKPIIEIGRVTEAMSQMDFSKKIHYDSEDELGQLAGSIQILSHSLEANRSALKKEIAFQKVLTQNMSHELKTPISVIKGYVEALQYGVAQDQETQEEYMQIVLSECDRMNELVSQMLHLSKLTTYQDRVLEKEAVSPEDFVQEIKRQAQGILEQKQLPFHYDIACEEGAVLWVHFKLLSQAFGNFVTNAVKYGDGKEIRMSIQEEGAHFVLSLYNSGLPIPLEEWDKVFDVFYMVDKVRGRENNSHGLGLSVSKTIVELHQGRVSCYGVEDGTVFSMHIPKNSG